MQTIMYSIDWCQYSVQLLAPITPGVAPGNPLAPDAPKPRPAFATIGDTFVGSVPLGAWQRPLYHVIAGREYSRQFRQSFTITAHGMDIVHIFFDPVRADMDRGRCIFKAANRLLYVQGWPRVLADIIHLLSGYIVSLSRLDVCADFNCFANGVQPLEFIRRYFAAPTAEVPSYLRHSSNRYRVHGQKNIYEDGRAPEVQHQTLSFGTRESAVQTNLYNKSEELRTHDKPYIRSAWVAAGLNPADVWRVEFSLNSRGVACCSWNSDLIQELDPMSQNFEQLIGGVFCSYAAQYFSFHEYYDGETRGIRSLPYANLFELPEELPLKPRSMNVKRNSGRTEVICARLLSRILRDTEGMPKDVADSYRCVIHELKELGAVKACASSGVLAVDEFLIEMSAALAKYGKEVRQPHVKAMLARAHRLVSLVMASKDKDVQAFRDTFPDILERFGLEIESPFKCRFVPKFQGVDIPKPGIEELTEALEEGTI